MAGSTTRFAHGIAKLETSAGLGKTSLTLDQVGIKEVFHPAKKIKRSMP